MDGGNIINRRVESILKSVHNRGVVENICFEDSWEIDKELSEEMFRYHQEYLIREHKSLEEAGRVVLYG